MDKAVEMHVRRYTFSKIAEELEVTPNTASKLVHDGLSIRAEHRDRAEAREESIAFYELIITEGLKRLDGLDSRSNNVTGILNAIKDAQARIDKLTGVEAPVKSEVDVNDRRAQVRAELDQLEEQRRAELVG